MSSGDAGSLEHRASDADRERVASALRDHLAEGRLTVSEFEGRLDVVYRARTMGDLVAVTRDLPDAPRAAPRGRPAAQRPRMPGHFRVHASVWLAFVLFWTIIWALSGGGDFWPVWPAVSWGLGVAIHGVVAYNVVAERHRRQAGRAPGA